MLLPEDILCAAIDREQERREEDNLKELHEPLHNDTGTIVPTAISRQVLSSEGDEALRQTPFRDLGQAIKKLRLERDITQQQLADASGLDIRYVGSIERGQRNPTFGALQGIASVFGMKTSDLLRKAKLF